MFELWNVAMHHKDIITVTYSPWFLGPMSRESPEIVRKMRNVSCIFMRANLISYSPVNSDSNKSESVFPEHELYRRQDLISGWQFTPEFQRRFVWYPCKWLCNIQNTPGEDKLYIAGVTCTEGALGKCVEASLAHAQSHRQELGKWAINWSAARN